MSTEPIVRRSVLDRLIQSGDAEPRSGVDSVRALKGAVLRDVEWLLNTRRIARPAPTHLTELSSSVYHFGLPDTTSVSPDSKRLRQELLLEIKACIERFEPRLAAVRVTEPLAEGEGRRDIRFRVEAVLRLDPEPEPIFFDTVLDEESGRFNVPGGP